MENQTSCRDDYKSTTLFRGESGGELVRLPIGHSARRPIVVRPFFHVPRNCSRSGPMTVHLKQLVVRVQGRAAEGT